MKNDTYYFSHDSNAKDDPKCVMLIEQLGCEGYGIYWILIETLRSQPDYKYPLQLVGALARRYNTSSEKMLTVVKSYNLFNIEEDMFFSLRLLRAMEAYNAKRLKYIEAGSKGGQASVKQRSSKYQAIKGNKRKGNKRKEVGEGAAAPAPKSYKVWSNDEFVKDIEVNKREIPKDQLNAFFKYWSEKSPSGKMKFQLQDTWETSKRLDTWNKRQEKFEVNGHGKHTEQKETFNPALKNRI
jgi:hypothetical protein